jgi:very-short-patch-repair endonuclease
MSARGEVLVAILNNRRDFAIARDSHWYRIPVASADKWLKTRWPPEWLAFYQTKAFGPEKHAVNYYARVLDIRQVRRWQLLEMDSRDPKWNRLYYQLLLGPLRRLPQPILSRRWRRIVFIPTTWKKFVNAVEINDLYDESPLEDHLWAALKRLEIRAERQLFVAVEKHHYALDFAIPCATGKIDVETDGDLWHANRQRAGQDNLRDNALKTKGWQVLRFNTAQIQEKMETYTLPTVVENIERLGGVDEGRLVPRHIDRDMLKGVWQLGLFDEVD